MPSFGSGTPFMLLAKLKIKEDKVAEYLKIADKRDKLLKQTNLECFITLLIQIKMILFVLYGQKF